MNRKLLFASVLPMVLAASPAFSQICTGAASEGWDEGLLNGWGGFAGTLATVENIGGNPEGYVRAEDIGQAGILTSAAPWIGDWPDEIRELVVDVQAFGTGDGVVGPYFRLRLDGATNGWLYSVGSQFPIDGQWHRIVIPLNPSWTDPEAEANGWTLLSGTGEYSWAEVMASLGFLIVAVEGVSAEEWVGFDNIGRDCGLFFDNFESTDTSAWSVSFP